MAEFGQSRPAAAPPGPGEGAAGPSGRERGPDIRDPEQVAVWSAGEYATVSRQLAPLVAQVVDALAVREGERVLDLACGDGNAALAAAHAGATVTAVDHAPRLLEQAAARAADVGATIECLVGDARAVPVADAAVDVAVSTFGMIFAPEPERVAGELARVLVDGGRLAFSSWPPVEQFDERLAAAIPPPVDASTTFRRWGDPEDVARMLSPWFDVVTIEQREGALRWDDLDEALEFFTTGAPTCAAAFHRLDTAAQADVRARLRDVLPAVYGDGAMSHPLQWNLVTARRRTR